MYIYFSCVNALLATTATCSSSTSRESRRTTRLYTGSVWGLSSFFFGGWGCFFEWKRLGNRGYLVLSCANRPFPLVSLALQTEQIKIPPTSRIRKSIHFLFFFFTLPRKKELSRLSVLTAPPHQIASRDRLKMSLSLLK